MRRSLGGALAAGYGVLILVSVSAASAAPRDDVRAALQRMHQWVGTGQNGQRWRTYLKSDQLMAELTEPGQADASALEEVLARYESSATGLDMPRFAAVRKALRQWIDSLPRPSTEQLVKAARQAKEAFKPVSDKKLERARSRLAGAVERLDAYLVTGGANGDAWKAYLKWPMLEAQLAPGQSPNLARLVEVYRQFTANEQGLELPVFADVADALRAYLDLVSFTQPEDPRQRFQQQLEALAEALRRYGEQPSEPDHRAIGERLGWLDAGGQAAALVRKVRRTFSLPNLLAKASKELVEAGFARDVDRVDPVRDVILGTRIRGTARTTGHVSLDFVPHVQQAVLETVFKGTSASRTRGWNGPVTIYSDSKTRIHAIKRIVIDQTGLRGLPAVTAARTRTALRGIGTSHGGLIGRIVRNQASQRVAQNRPRSELIAARHAEERVNRRVDAESNARLAKGNRRFQEDFRKPLVRQRAFPRLFRFSTTPHRLMLTALQASPYQLGAPDEPPALQQEHDLDLSVHESMLNNLAASLIADRKFTDEDAKRAAIDLLGEVPEKLRKQQDDLPWSITFTRREPLTMLFADNGFELTLRGSAYTSGERSYPAMNITVAYRLKQRDDGVTLVREGDLEILPPGFVEGQSTLSASQVALRRLIARKLGKVFEPEIVGEGIELEGQWSDAGRLVNSELICRGGWLALGYDLVPEEAPAGN